MGLIPRFSEKDILKQLQGGVKSIEQQIFRVFSFVGEQFVKDARENVTDSVYSRTVYDKQGRVRQRESWELTGNLRSSIGYFILKDGEILKKSLSGTQEGMKAALELVTELPTVSGYQLIGCAGMSYASNVESKGYDVITVAGDNALVDLNRRVMKLKDEINRRGVSGDFAASNLFTVFVQ
jgi:hypothetical protein